MFYKGLLALCLLCGITVCANAQYSGIAADTIVFVASTPCSQGTKPLPGIAKDAPCELMKWKLMLYSNSFTLVCDYGMPLQGTKGLVGGGKHVNLSGKWRVNKGMPGNTQATLYRLTDSATGKIISLIKLSDDLLHLLDDDSHLMIGTAAWSYTLNRIK